MRRRYTRESYLELVASLREAMPDIALSTDMIVGFSGETEADFADTLSLTAAVRYHSMFSFKYSPRPNTLALKRMDDDVPEEEKTRRIVALQTLQRDVQGELYREAIGREERVLVDARSRRRELGAVGTDERQYHRELRGAAGVDRPDRHRAHHRGEPEQPARRGDSHGREGASATEPRERSEPAERRARERVRGPGGEAPDQGSRATCKSK